MKKLIFNGCSYTAGDACAWDLFCPEIPWTRQLWSSAPSQELMEKYGTYRLDFRPKYNIGGVCANKLNAEKIDLSQDGNANSMIALRTIDYILSLRPDSRKNYHVCIGWTEYARRAKWSNKHLKLETLHVSHLDHPEYSEFENYIKQEIVLNTDTDHVIHYIKDVMLLENFLKAQGMTYTFWRALGVQPQIPKDLSKAFTISENISNNDNWIPFNQNDPIRIVGSTWTDVLHQYDDYVTEDNLHPNLKAINAHADRVCDHILKYS